MTPPSCTWVSHHPHFNSRPYSHQLLTIIRSSTALLYYCQLLYYCSALFHLTTAPRRVGKQQRWCGGKGQFHYLPTGDAMRLEHTAGREANEADRMVRCCRLRLACSDGLCVGSGDYTLRSWGDALVSVVRSFSVALVRHLKLACACTWPTAPRR